MSTHRLTPFQREEVEILLGNAREQAALDAEAGEPLTVIWGYFETPNLLVVTDWRSARMDLHDRADWHESEAPQHGQSGTGAAQSLTRLADAIYEAREDAQP